MHALLRLMAVLCLLVASACMSFAGDMDGISPSQFKFVSVVRPKGAGSGGWKEARLVITLVRALNNPETVTCTFLVGVPEINHQGVITDGFAQRMAALAADTAASRVAGQGYFSAELCERFKDEMERELKRVISGSRVKKIRL
jgi:hypothetical protein